MKIIFLCGSLEPGRDGVGDYSRRLAGELIRQGHQAAAVALNDRQISEEYEGTQETGNIILPVLRVPSIWSSKQRFDRTRKWIDIFEPEWLSLQFVPYSFQRKGMPVGLAHYLASFNERYRWHIMFHEIWLDAPHRLSQRIVAWAQQLIIIQCINKIKPAAVHVSMPFNQSRLQKNHIKSEVLHLFGNISKGNCEETLLLFNNSNFFSKNILYFGTAPRGKFLDLVKRELANFCQNQKLPIRIIVAAGNSIEKDIFIKYLTEELTSLQVTVVDCGFIEAEAISTLMSKCTVGIARTEAHLLGKSGSAMAMLEHGMPVWLPKWKDDTSLEITFRTNLVFSDLYKAIKTSTRPEYFTLLPDVAKKLIYQLTII